MLGFQRRLVRRCEWEMLFPKLGDLPQTSQVAATVDSLAVEQIGDSDDAEAQQGYPSHAPAPKSRPDHG
jgi:hypothetical protein